MESMLAVESVRRCRLVVERDAIDEPLELWTLRMMGMNGWFSLYGDAIAYAQAVAFVDEQLIRMLKELDDFVKFVK